MCLKKQFHVFKILYIYVFQVFVNFVRQQSDATQRHCSVPGVASTVSTGEKDDTTKL